MTVNLDIVQVDCLRNRNLQVDNFVVICGHTLCPANLCSGDSLVRILLTNQLLKIVFKNQPLWMKWRNLQNCFLIVNWAVLYGQVCGCRVPRICSGSGWTFVPCNSFAPDSKFMIFRAGVEDAVKRKQVWPIFKLFKVPSWRKGDQSRVRSRGYCKNALQPNW